MKTKEAKPKNSGDNQVPRNEKGQVMPGYSLNPAGKPKGSRHFSTLFKELLKDKITLSNGTTLSIGEAMTRAMANKAMNGDVSAFNAVADRVDGKPQQSLEMSGELNVTNVDPEQKALIEDALDKLVN